MIFFLSHFEYTIATQISNTYPHIGYTVSESESESEILNPSGILFLLQAPNIEITYYTSNIY